MSTAHLTFAKGERVEFTSPHKLLRIPQHQRATIVAITPDAKLQVQLDPPSHRRSKPRLVQIDPHTFHHLHHTYAAATDFGHKTAADKPHTLVSVDSETLDGKALAARLDRAAALNEKVAIYCDNAGTLLAAVKPELAQRALLREQRHETTGQSQLTPGVRNGPGLSIPELVRRPAAEHRQSRQHATPQHDHAQQQQVQAQTPQPAHQQIQPPAPARRQQSAPDPPEHAITVNRPAKQQQIQEQPAIEHGLAL